MIASNQIDKSATDAFAEGLHSRRHHRVDTTCPYPPGSIERQDWLDGWHKPDALDKFLNSSAEAPQREAGFYWVDNGFEPEPACWDGEGWTFLGEIDTPSVPTVLSETPITFTTHINGLTRG